MNISFDNTWGNNGIYLSDDFMPNNEKCNINYILELENGKILGCGYIENTSNNNLYAGIFRFNTDGSLDTSFGSNNGWTITSYQGSFYKLLFDNYDNLLAFGGITNSDVLVTCFDSSGIINTNYGSNGSQTFDYGNDTVVLYDVEKSDSDQFIYAVGKNITDNRAIALKYGSYPTNIYKTGTFASSGYFNSGESGDLNQLILYNSYVYCFGQSGGSSLLIKLDEDGNQLIKKKYSVPSNTYINSVIQDVDKFVISAQEYAQITLPDNQNSNWDFAIFRVDVDTLNKDTTFAVNGVYNVFLYTFSSPLRIADRGTRIAKQYDGKYIVAGQTRLNTTSTGSGEFNLGLIRVNTNGTIDTSFGNNGEYVFDANTTNTNDEDILDIEFDSTNNNLLIAGIYNDGNKAFTSKIHIDDTGAPTSMDPSLNDVSESEIVPINFIKNETLDISFGLVHIIKEFIFDISDNTNTIWDSSNVIIDISNSIDGNLTIQPYEISNNRVNFYRNYYETQEELINISIINDLSNNYDISFNVLINDISNTIIDNEVIELPFVLQTISDEQIIKNILENDISGIDYTFDIVDSIYCYADLLSSSIKYKMLNNGNVEFQIMDNSLNLFTQNIQKDLSDISFHLFNFNDLLQGKYTPTSNLQPINGNLGEHYVQFLASILFNHPLAQAPIKNDKEIIDNINIHSNIGLQFYNSLKNDIVNNISQNKIVESIFRVLLFNKPKRFSKINNQFHPIPILSGDVIRFYVKINSQYEIPNSMNYLINNPYVENNNIKSKIWEINLRLL